MSAEDLEPQEGEPLIAFELQRVHDIEPKDMLIRFGFGAGVSVVAALMTLAAGPRFGGMFLAFPAILPATLTLLEKKHDTDAAVHTDRGALLGSVGLCAFAVAAAVLFARTSAAFVVLAAVLAWSIASVALYLAVAAWRREHRPAGSRRGSDGPRTRRMAPSAQG